MSEWFYQVMGEVKGPLSLEEAMQKVAEGEIARDSLVREDADGEWVVAAGVEELFPNATGSAAGPESTEEFETVVTEIGPGQATAIADTRRSGVRKSPLALHPCLDCGQMVSRQANSCPHCGRLFHESSMTVRYQGEHPVPVLVFFTILAVVFLLASPVAVYFFVARLASNTLSTDAATGLAAVATVAYLGSMIVCALVGGAVGKPKMAYVTGLFLGLFFGPLGVFAAYAMDKRPQCCHCLSRLDGLARECPRCHARLSWRVEPSWF